MRPVGGWRPLQRDNAGATEDVTIPVGEATQSHAWLDNGSAPYLAAGTSENLYGADVSLVFDDITPIGFQGGVIGENLGYGGKKYGKSTYGTSRIADGIVSPLSVWSMDNWGEELLACTSSDRTLYHWDLITSEAEEIVNAPPLEYMVITAERFVFALGADNNPRKIAWCDREDYNTWIPTQLNQAGDIELQTKGGLQGGVRVRGRTLLLTQYDAFVGTYQGPPVIYGFQNVGKGCGLLAPNTLVATTNAAFWMSDDSFFMYDGSSCIEIPCDVQDYVFLDISTDSIRKAWGVSNDKNGEVWWFYPSADSLECNRYVAYDYTENHWLIGELNRSTGVDVGAYRDPFWIKSSGEVYRHETGNLHDGVNPFIESGPILLGAGDNLIHATNVLQDELLISTVDTAKLEMAFSSLFWPDAQIWEHGPYVLDSPTNVRFTGRQVRMKIEAEDGKDWRIGGIRLEYEVGGRR
jgi:hypothetical protein